MIRFIAAANSFRVIFDFYFGYLTFLPKLKKRSIYAFTAKSKSAYGLHGSDCFVVVIIAVRVILDISPMLFFINFERTWARVVSKLIKSNKDDISQISQTVLCFLINHIFTNKHCTFTFRTSNQRDDYKKEGFKLP